MRNSKSPLYLLLLVVVVAAASLAATVVRQHFGGDEAEIADVSPVVLPETKTASSTAPTKVVTKVSAKPVETTSTSTVAIGAGLDASVATIENAVDTTYDDSALSTQFTNDTAASLVDSYDF